MKLNIAWWQDKWADLVSGGILPSCPQWNHEGCCKTQEDLQTVSIQNNNFGTFSQHCLGCPGETERHKILVRLRLKQCSVVVYCSYLQPWPKGLQRLEHRHGHSSFVHLDPQVPVIKAGVVLDRSVVLWQRHSDALRTWTHGVIPCPTETVCVRRKHVICVTQEHVEQLFVLKHDGSLHKILKVRVNTGSDTSILSHPLLRLDINVVSHLDRKTG